MQHRGTQRIETARLLLRPFRVEDAEDMFRNWAHDPEVTRYLTWAPHESPEATRALLTLWAKEAAEDPSVYKWAIERKALGQVIGSLTVVHVDEATESVELGYCMGKAWWGQGIMTEAVRAVCAYLFEEVGVRRVTARHDVENPASGAVMRKAGMTKEGVLRRSARNTRGIVDMAVYSILREEWEALLDSKSAERL